MFANIEQKSYNAAISGLGGKFTTAVDPATGTPCPSVDFGSLDTSVMSHKPGDGTQVNFTTQKSFWGSEVGSQTCRINCKSGIKSMIITAMPRGQTVVSLEEYDSSVTIDNTGKKFCSELTSIIGKNPAGINVKIKAMLAKAREADAANSKTKDRFVQLAAMSDAELSALKAGSDLVDNRLIGNEVLWRVINRNNTAETDTSDQSVSPEVSVAADPVPSTDSGDVKNEQP
ncbi:MAG: hypothetical protein PHH77_03510 [Victivallaceae bacterium]|nr:hypothetical protein [Victivallaceae bacterium]